jgi:anti-sigma factor RsiW
MSACANPVRDLLPSYAAGSLSTAGRQAVEAHLAACPACREDLAFWREVGGAVVAEDRALPAPSPALLAATLHRVRPGRVSPLRRAWALLCGQVPLVRREIWLASALVMAMGYVVALLVGSDGGGRLLEALAPLVTAAGLAAIYGPENDPGLELALATPTSPRQVLLARLTLVFGYDLLLALLATLGLATIVPWGLLGTIILNWLAPMTFLSALALVASLITSTSNAVTLSFSLWLTRFMVGGVKATAAGQMDLAFQAAARAYLGAWSTPALLFALAGALVLLALWLAGRPVRGLTRA